MGEALPRQDDALADRCAGWRHTTDNNYAFRMKSFTFNAQNVFTGVGGTVQVYDPNGVLVTTLCADSVGTRFEL